MNEVANKFYTAIDDVQLFAGTRSKMVKVEGACYRFSLKKFQRDAHRAVELMFLNIRHNNTDVLFPDLDRVAAVLLQSDGVKKKIYDPEIIKAFWDNVNYDKQEHLFTFDEYFTDHGHVPTDTQMKNFNVGKYKFFKIHHEIQVLETNLVEFSLNHEQKLIAE